ncbi:hypothetical protein [Rhizobium laguerreae]|uniref:hypothetical protein n=1 Tax=Rhizobium laguerreae TaxID=1076926 RepID=UPI001C9115C4|nr:hypothetical protein [Rhizobium laguerreae]MBY3188794.1 hypothetical protein [Rhizobium laguerreae]
MTKLREKLKTLAHPPSENAGVWLGGAEDGVSFLKDHLKSNEVILFASMNAVLIHGVLVPELALQDADHEQLSREFLTTDVSWIIEHVSGGGEPDRVYLEGPLRRLGSTFNEGEKLVFKRFFSARRDLTPIEISQKMVHALDLHFMTERNAWCRLDEDGDIEEVIKIIEEHSDDWSQDVTLVTILTKDFEEYMRLSNSALFYFFDFTRTQPGSFNGWSEVDPINFDAPDLFYHGGVMGQSGSYINGRMIFRPTITYEEIVAAHMERRNPSVRQYATFKAIDLKTQASIETSADPEGLSNYFQPESDLPLEMSPVFFRAEVLQRYKSDPDKYDLDDRSIACRGTWSLRTYDINEEGQVHTYLRYLAELPYKEQIYWQAFNEWPKGWLSKRAITTDFKGEFHLEHEPLAELKRFVKDLDHAPPSWWQARGEMLRKAVRYPVTNSISEWGNEILALDHLVNEGFLLTPLRRLAVSIGVTVKDEWRSHKVLEETVAQKNGDRVEAKAVIDPLRRLRELRNHLKGHASDKKQSLAKEALRAHGSFRGHCEVTANQVLEALKVIKATLE